MRLKNLIFLFTIIAILFGCNNKIASTKEGPDISKTYSFNENKLNNDSILLKKVNQFDDYTNINKYELNKNSCSSNLLIAPAYVNETSIIFLDSSDIESRIIEFIKSTKECKLLYTAKGIGQLTGEANYIFWTEYDTTKYTNVDWSIKSLNLSNKEINLITKGKSYKETPPPTLKTYNNSLSWIEYNSDSNLVTSKLITYSVTNNKKSVIETIKLDEKTIREGGYLIAHASTSNNDYLIYKSLFNKGNKSFEISLTKGNPTELPLLTEDYIIDFAISNEFFAYTGEGHLTSFSLKGNRTYKKFLTGNTLTTDTPIFIEDNKLIFRYAMNDLFIIDLDKNIYTSLLDKKNLTVSKPIYNNDILAFGEIDNDNNVTFVEMKFK